MHGDEALQKRHCRLADGPKKVTDDQINVIIDSDLHIPLQEIVKVLNLLFFRMKSIMVKKKWKR